MSFAPKLSVQGSRTPRLRAMRATGAPSRDAKAKAFDQKAFDQKDMEQVTAASLYPTHSSYLSSKCIAQSCPAKGGLTVFAAEEIGKGELIAVWSGRVIPYAEMAALPSSLRRRTVQVEEELFLTSLGEDEPADFINHSCEPNAGLAGQISIIAMREIAPGEEITIDYAMCDGSPYDEFPCACQSAHCRGRVTGEDWLLPELWARYAGHFSPYLQRRIDRLRGAGNRRTDLELHLGGHMANGHLVSADGH